MLYETYLDNTQDLFIMPGFGERYPNKLEGILGSVSQSYDGRELFPSIGESASAYFVKLIIQHPFRDGNKRMAVYFTDIFLWLNGVKLDIDWKEMYELAKFVVLQRENGTSSEKLKSLVLKIIEDNSSSK